ncbi:endonuclease III [Geobacter chapellei]|uniref:Endonuclease III n=1 Tax=Pelotalea chapellei TaxID=44671 RepID=A0ABS5UCU4_9BACT|nr:endonuclease III [Pelotalea chapellei]MBT1073527.1 endonuclease III [Pelotalea chapellei]
MKPFRIDVIINFLRLECKKWETPAVTIIAECFHDPFKVLISCLISLRTRDEVTATVSARLFSKATTPQKIQQIPLVELEELLYPAGFYRKKARQIKDISHRLMLEFGGQVPDDIDALMRLNGVGRKTANLVVTIGFGKPGICVDTHVHRICNRWGYVSTRTPHATEMALRAQLPPEYWISINELLVAFGQNHCTPLSPHCSTCRISGYCSRVGVSMFR